MRILIVDDSELSRLSIKSELEKSYKVKEADNLKDAEKLLKQVPFDLCFIDLNLDQSNDLQGLRLIPVAVENGVYPVVMSSYETDDVIKKAYALGCQDYYSKGNEKAKVEETIRRFYESKEEFTKDLVSRIFPTYNPTQRKNIEKMGPIIHTDIPLHIEGKTGSGKTYFAEKIHSASKRPGQFIAVNCGAISPDLMEAELFGYAKGAFTGATEGKSGKILLAHNGTLFLDEIGSMPMSLQVKFLKVLDDGKFYPVNSDKQVYSSFRIISAGLDNLLELVQKGLFRKDLYQRLAGYSITLLPLCERKEDIMPLIREVTSSTRRIAFSDEAKEFILNYSWPGNVRQLMHFARVLSTLSRGIVTEEQVKLSITESSSTLTPVSLVTDDHLNLIKQVGLQEFLNIMRDEAIRLGLDRTGGNGRRLISEFKMSAATYHRFTKGAGKMKEMNFEVQ